MLGEKYEQFIYMNLENVKDAACFRKFPDIQKLMQAILLEHNMTREKQTLLFIDEIQEEPIAIKQLRYFYEDFQDIHVVAAGSLLESAFSKSVSFPVGRVEYMILRPVCFSEFLEATGAEQALKAYLQLPVPDYAHISLLHLFHDYALIGGMPEVVMQYSQGKEIASLSTIYESLLRSYLDDVEKYARNERMIHIVRHVIRSSVSEAGTRIKYHGFGKSEYSSKDCSESLRALEKAFLLQIIHPVTRVDLPMMPDLKRSPKLHFLDTGLVNYFSGIQHDILGASDLCAVYKGRIAEHITGQEIIASQSGVLEKLNFWVREKKTSNAELDYVLQRGLQLIPIEVKSGSSGRLKSMHMFMETANAKLGIRLHSGFISKESILLSSGKTYQLLNLPYYLAGRIPEYL
jgi:predicted AAA+ superfamily ATPase